MGANCEMNQMSKLLCEMPKVEIHTHLIGTADAETIYKIAQRNRVALPVASHPLGFSDGHWTGHECQSCSQPSARQRDHGHWRSIDGRMPD